jgi:uncharacterized protein DUF1835
MTLDSAPLHVTNGDSAASTLRQTRIGGAVLPWQDVLHEGPVPLLPRSELLAARAAFLADCGWGTAAAILSELERRDAEYLDALRTGTHVVLWFEHDLYDQLQLIDALALANDTDATPDLIVVDSFPGRPSFRGLGELTAGELEELWPRRRAATPDALAVAAEVWEALRAPEPTALAAWLRRAPPDLPFLPAAIRRLLDEVPSADNGLSGTERRALEAIAGGARTAGAAFLAAQDLEKAPFLGDSWFFRTLTILGSAPVRLVDTVDGELRLTNDGEQVLRGDADRVALVGLDRWIGGTHLTPGNAWRWDAAAEALVEPRATL